MDGKIPLITEIQRFSLQDGPGIRTTVFFKGCPLKCPWCHNPETQDARREFYFYSGRCTNCGRCAEVCTSGASIMSRGDGSPPVLELDRSKCIRCMTCVEACLSNARAIVGQEMSLDDIVKEVLSDRLFYGNSGGGLTISGGEPLFFPEITLELAKRLKEESIDVAIETSCFQKWDKIELLLPFIDLFLVDIKSFDPEKHRQIIGWPLSPILENIERLIAADANVRIHLPIIPDFNNNEEHFENCLEFLGKLAGRLNGVDILPYHVYGEKKYEFLGKDNAYPYKNIDGLSANEMLPFAKKLKSLDIADVTFGGLIGMKKSQN